MRVSEIDWVEEIDKIARQLDNYKDVEWWYGGDMSGAPVGEPLLYVCIQTHYVRLVIDTDGMEDACERLQAAVDYIKSTVESYPVCRNCVYMARNRNGLDYGCTYRDADTWPNEWCKHHKPKGEIQ